ncbi:MAG: hypothetical protein FWB71_02835, partial [Defluviitaleaceae bacterium]|nr:hypothetical protein [Defluviitaleaceae bacterium]
IILDERVVDFHCDAKPKPAPPDKKELEMDFHNELLHCTKIIHENGYHAGFIMKMIHEIGGYKTAQRLIKKDPPKGFKNLASRGLLKYSLEALVLQPKYAPLFTDAQIETCRKHLETHGESDSRLVRWAGFGF